MNRLAQTTIITILSLIIIFHILVLTSIIPYDIVWGGRITSQQQMIPLVLASTLLNAVFLLIILVYCGIWKVNISNRILKISIWAMMFFFLLNTLGNLMSESNFEKWVFAPTTLILSWSLLQLALNSRSAGIKSE